jgi:hypothetical protein
MISRMTVIMTAPTSPKAIKTVRLSIELVFVFYSFVPSLPLRSKDDTLASVSLLGK